MPGDGVERKRFTFEFANDCWQTDMLGFGDRLMFRITLLLAFQ